MYEEIDLSQFSGVLPLFPLPKVVMFPQIILPLHIFEKRYQKLLADAMEGEKYIGMSILKPGWEEQYEGNPGIYSHACLGKIIKHESLDNGRSNILLLGIQRVQINEILVPKPYRLAKVDLIQDDKEGMESVTMRKYRNKLLSCYSEVIIEYAASKRKFPTLSDIPMDLGQLTDVLAASLGLSVSDQVYLLKEKRIKVRAKFVYKRMKELLERGGPSMKSPINPPQYLDINLN